MGVARNKIIKLLKYLFKFLFKIKYFDKFCTILLKIIFCNYTFITHQNLNLKFSNINHITNYRIKSFKTKEPETLSWIESFEKNSVFWDIGANIGLYSIYASKLKNCQTIAFEPSVFNLELLARNIFLNKLDNKISIFPLPLSANSNFNIFNYSYTLHGGALNTFNFNFDQSGSLLKSNFKVNTFGISPNEVITKLNLNLPDYVKIDVDGIEHIILQNSSKILQHTKSLIVEINDDFYEQKNECFKILSNLGFFIKSKYSFQNTKNQFNYHWVRK